MNSVSYTIYDIRYLSKISATEKDTPIDSICYFTLLHYRSHPCVLAMVVDFCDIASVTTRLAIAKKVCEYSAHAVFQKAPSVMELNYSVCEKTILQRRVSYASQVYSMGI